MQYQNWLQEYLTCVLKIFASYYTMIFASDFLILWKFVRFLSYSTILYKH